MPGWGFTWPIFFKPGTFSEGSFDFLVPQKAVTPKTASSLCALLPEVFRQKRRVVILGWSLGGLPAIEAFKRFENEIEKMILVAVRKKYTPEEIEAQSDLIKKDRLQALYDFYRRCFLGQKEDFKWFKNEIMKDCIKAFPENVLLQGLDYLMQPIDSACLDNEKVCFVYGSKDAIIPEGLRIHQKKAYTIVLHNTGHIPFLSSEFEIFLKQTFQTRH